MKSTRLALCDVRGSLADLYEKLSGDDGATIWLPALNKMLRRENPWEATDPRFVPINEFEIKVPKGYVHGKCLTTFVETHGKEFYFLNSAITDQNFGNPTTRLEPGRKLKVTVFQIRKKVSSEDCLAFLKSQKAVLAGAQVLSLVYEQKKEELPVGKWSISFDDPDHLWLSDGHRGVPRVSRYSVGDYSFNLGDFEVDWGSDLCLLCFSVGGR